MTRIRPFARRSVVASLLLVGIVALAGPAGAYTGVRPTFATSNVYFHCTGDTKLYNLNWTEDLGDESAYARWDPNPPAQSVEDGAGCTALDAGWVTNEVYDPVFQGTFTGNLRALTVHIHEFLFNQTRQGATQPMRVYAEIDGTPIFPKGSTDGAYDGRGFTVTPSPENAGVTDLVEFTITNIGYADPVYDSAGNLVDVRHGGVAEEDGDGTQVHTLKLMLGVDSFVGDDPPTGSDLWVWDTREVPSGITFNPEEPADATVAADLPTLEG